MVETIQQKQQSQPSKLDVINTITKNLMMYSKIMQQLENLKTQKKNMIDEIDMKFMNPIADLEKKQDNLFNSVNQIAEEFRQLIFENGKKSLSTDAGEIRFKICPPKIVSTTGEKLDDYKEEIEDISSDLIKVKKTVSSEAIISNRDNDIIICALNALGFYITQEEKFMIDLKKRKR